MGVLTSCAVGWRKREGPGGGRVLEGRRGAGMRSEDCGPWTPRREIESCPHDGDSLMAITSRAP